MLPIVAAVFIAVAPGQIAKRYASMFNMNDPTVRDRVAMLHIGERMVAARPLTGVGPNMLQIAAERGLVALALWLWFIVAVVRDLWQRFSSGRQRELAAAALATTGALLAAGFFEYNFGDSEVLMLFLIIVTLPASADRSTAA